MRLTITRAHLAILFAIFFIAVGWIAPAMYAGYAPQENFITVNSFEAEDATVDDKSHAICFDRDVKQENTAEVFTKLYLVSPEKDTRIQLNSQEVDTFLQEGDRTVQFTNTLPDNLSAGQYKYVLVVNMDLSNGRVERVFEFESEQFQIAEDTEMSIRNTAC